MRTDGRIPLGTDEGGRWIRRAREQALFWTVLLLLGAGALVSFYYEEFEAPESKAYEAGEAAGTAPKDTGRIYRYQTDHGELTVYPAESEQ